jgi:proteasome assembly chaperone 3
MRVLRLCNLLNQLRNTFFATEYADRIFVHITQMGKFGTIMKAWAEPRSEGGSIYHVSTLMGKRDDPLLQIYARQIIERLSATSSKPLLLALSLKAESRDAGTFQSILNELFQHSAWNL